MASPPLMTLPTASCVMRTTRLSLETMKAGDESDLFYSMFVSLEEYACALYGAVYVGVGDRAQIKAAVGHLSLLLCADDIDAAKARERSIAEQLRSRGIVDTASVETALYSLRVHVKLAHTMLSLK